MMEPPIIISSIMLQLPDLHISDNTELVLSAAGCLAVVGIIARAYLYGSKSTLPLPPSPPTWKLRGHALPPPNPFLDVEKWIEEYGPLITIRRGTEKIVIIGRHQAAIDIMEKQGASLADRPHTVAAGEMWSNGLVIGFVRAGDRLRRMRRALHSHLQPKAAEAYQPLQMSYAKNTVLGLLKDPHGFQEHVKEFAATTITKIAFGRNAADDEIAGGHKFLETLFAIARPGIYLVDSFPWLRYLPWYGKELRQQYESNRKLFTAQLHSVKQQMESNVDPGPSFGRHLLENEQLYGMAETEMAFLSGSFFAAGYDTTSTAICTVLMAAACFPEELAKVQAEIDAVIGGHRAPTFADEESLPRLRAFIVESMRWRPLAPMGFPHRTTKDVIWENYCIPAGTTVFGSHWSIFRDPKVYPDPYAFKPQRWIDDEGHMKDTLTFFLYGFGRRACPGLHVANRSMFINSALIFWAFNVALDDTKPLNDLGYVNAVMPLVEPCSLEFKKRIPEPEIRRMLQNYPEDS
ncbi:cytochrome P450 [Suillus clintonianus]|uniref:cytochrome P450 n=1 Tax=Suillus clintonianus TaxID=1904413 RepID=UPI001B882A88|nr:cytochrome P450 [Suillus clintonianus]KAG2143070.1 cytochrome P450 [Suillus clintonianus]